jgi:hypothetical protein
VSLLFILVVDSSGYYTVSLGKTIDVQAEPG